MSDMLWIGSGRAELTLTTTGDWAARVPIEQSELRVARILVARIPTTA